MVSPKLGEDAGALEPLSVGYPEWRAARTSLIASLIVTLANARQNTAAAFRENPSLTA